MASQLTVDNIVGATTAGNVHIPNHVVQMVNSSTTTTTTITSTSSYSDITGSSLTITPKFSTSKIVLFVNLHIYATETTANVWRGLLMRVMRGTTEIYGDAGSHYGEGSVENDGSQSRWMTYNQRTIVDTPGTTSAITYQCQGISKAGNTVYVNRGDYGAGGTMVAMEIAQ